MTMLAIQLRTGMALGGRQSESIRAGDVVALRARAGTNFGNTSAG
jgi:hypothetical protein